jgi:hypothetical protein
MSTIIEINCATGESIEREMTAEEIAEQEVRQAAAQAMEAERLAAEEALAALKASARAKLIAGEKLTPEEADVLVI